MIYVSFGGRLGNQFLTYALVKYLWVNRGRKEEMLFNFPLYTDQEIKDGFENVLQYFNIGNNSTETGGNVVLRYGSLVKKLFYPLFLVIEKYGNRYHWLKKCSTYLRRYLPKQGIYRNYQDVPVWVSQKKDIFVVGLCSEPRCFSSIREELQADFTPAFPPLEENSLLYDVIQNTNSVCVSIRRGDYVTTYKKDFFLCDEDYFRKAIEVIRQRVDNPVIIFFSDDIQWVKDNIHVDLPCYYESGNDPIWEKLRLMYSCKHFIISNSTFSWWAQFLSRNDDKIVVAPDRWYGNKRWSSPLLQDNFIKIEMG